MTLETGETDWFACTVCRVETLHRAEVESMPHTIRDIGADGETVTAEHDAGTIEVERWRCVQCGHPLEEDREIT